MPPSGIWALQPDPMENLTFTAPEAWETIPASASRSLKPCGKARTRYMQEILGGPEKYAGAFLEKLNQVLASGENLDLAVAPWEISKKGNGSAACGARVIPQKQDGLYTVVWHPLGGQPDPVTFCALSDLLADMEDAEMRLAPDETAYIVNLTGDEAKLVLAATGDGAET